MEWISSVSGQEELHVLVCVVVGGEGSGLNVLPPELPSSNSVDPEDLSVDGFKLVPLIVKPVGVNRVLGASTQNGFIEEGIRAAIPLLLSLPLF